MAIRVIPIMAGAETSIPARPLASRSGRMLLSRLQMSVRVVVLLGVLATALAPARAPELRFVRDGTEVKHVEVAELMRACRVTTIDVDDPNYEAHRRYLACPLADVLRVGFGDVASTLAGADVFFRAWDGYDKSTAGDRVAEDGAYLAFGDASLSEGATLRWAPLGRRAVDPGPLYLVWTKPPQRDTNRYPWPYQLAEIEISDFRRKYPHTVPTGAARDGAAWEGFEIFRGECIACHSVNTEGGKVGPDLNVPRSIVEYRPIDQIKAYVRDPSTFRYGNMPAHPDLSDAQLDALIAYFQTMKGLKHDPGARR